MDKEKTAEENRVTFGRTKSEKLHTTRLNDLEDRTLDQKRLARTRHSKNDVPDDNTSL